MQQAREPLFAPGFRICDALLISIVAGTPLLLYWSLDRVSLNWVHAGSLALAVVPLLDLLRLRIAFALLAIPFFAWAAISIFRMIFLPPTLGDLVNPLYVEKWVTSAFIGAAIGMYFWTKTGWGSAATEEDTDSFDALE
ncbi:MAG: hypothetical protein GC160_28975 [Acidobacteria bacterium]|nr:hypothetical protein [Acidobacteriota bacterium]